MTVTNEDYSAGPFTVSAATEYPYDFRVLAATDLRVVVTSPLGVQTVLGTGLYGVSGVDSQDGGSITLYDTSPWLGYALTMSRNMDATQEVNLVNQGAYYAEVIEKALDRLTMLVIGSRSLATTAMILRDGDVDGSGAFAARGNRVSGAAPGIASTDLVTVLQMQQQAASAGNVPSPTAGQVGYWLKATGTGLWAWTQLTLAGIAGITANAITLMGHTFAQMKSDLSLDQVNNTTDANKPVSTATSAAIAAAIAGVAASAFPAGLLFGMQMSNNTTDASNDIDFTAGSAADATNTAAMVQAAARTKQIDVAWAVGTNAGMLDTGTIDNTGAAPNPKVYHIFAIRRTDTGVVDYLASLSPTAPTMPASYTQKRRIGSILRVGAVNTPFLQFGDYFWHKTPVTDANVVAVGATDTTHQISVPTGVADMHAILAVRHESTSTTPSHIIYRGPDQTSVSASANRSYAASGARSAYAAGDPPGEENQQVVVQSGTLARFIDRRDSGVLIVSIWTLGWIDSRGRNG